MTVHYRIARTDREIAAAILLRLANHPEHPHDRFTLCFVYDYDQEFLAAVAKDVGADRVPTVPFLRRLRKVCRRLEICGVLYGQVRSCHAEDIGEPRTLKEYRFAKAEYAARLAPSLHPWYKPMGLVETELDFLLRVAYPAADD